MSTMISEFYSAFRKAGVPEEDAKAAAEALSSENLATKDDIRKLDKELTIIKWMLGLIIVVEIMPIFKNIMIPDYPQSTAILKKYNSCKFIWL